MTRNEVERKQRQEKLANLFFEMGMDLDLVEQMSGIDKKELLKHRIEDNRAINVLFNANSLNDNYNVKNRGLY